MNAAAPGRERARAARATGGNHVSPVRASSGAPPAPCGTGRDGRDGPGRRARPGAASAAAVQLGPLTGLRGDPFAGCTADNVAAQPGTNYPNTEIEPWVAANPAEPDNLVAGWQQDRWCNGGSRGLLAGVSRTAAPAGARPSRRPGHEVRGRPLQPRVRPLGRLLAQRHGLLHAPRLRARPAERRRRRRTRMLVTRSTDGGRTWGRPVTLIRDTDPAGPERQELDHRRPEQPNIAYAVWDRLTGFLAEEEERRRRRRHGARGPGRAVRRRGDRPRTCGREGRQAAVQRARRRQAGGRRLPPRARPASRARRTAARPGRRPG